MKDSAGMFVVVVLIAVLLMGGLLIQEGCSPSPSKAAAVLRASGFHDIKINDSSYATAGFYCSKDDSVAHHATAVNAAGEPVNLIVCCGIMKSCTVRVP